MIFFLFGWEKGSKMNQAHIWFIVASLRFPRKTHATLPYFTCKQCDCREKLVGDTQSAYTNPLDRPDTHRTRSSTLRWESTLYYFCCFMPHWFHTAIVGQCLWIIIKKDTFLEYALIGSSEGKIYLFAILSSVRFGINAAFKRISI